MSQRPGLHPISLQYPVRTSKQVYPAVEQLPPLWPPGSEPNVSGPKPAVSNVPTQPRTPLAVAVRSKDHQTGFSFSAGLLEPRKPQQGHELSINEEAGIAGITQ